MNLARTTYGIVARQVPPVLHRFGTISGRSCCGKAIAPLPVGMNRGLVVCQRCNALDKARREQMPDWF